jgi:O-antigen/teichoic acid export membrane protein
LTQIFLLPVYLSYWDKRTFGVWLAIQATASLTTLIDGAYQNYLGYEFLKVGSGHRARISELFSASIPISLIIEASQLVVVFLLVQLGAQDWLYGLKSGADLRLIVDAGLVLMIQAFSSTVVGGVAGTVVRVLTPFGYFPRMAWWGLLAGIVMAVAPAVAVIAGAGLLGAGVALGAASLLYCVPFFVDMVRLLRREHITVTRPDFSLGLSNLWKSSALIVKTFLEMARQQGIRIILSPMVGVSQMAAFATMRTGANSVLQGLNTITNPLLPELMRFLVSRDQAKSEASFGVVWLVVIVCMAPAVIVLQWVAPHLFSAWTRGKIVFDPLLFATLSDAILIYALSQPAMAVVQGNNLLRAQLVISALAGGTVILGLLALVPVLSILGAGIALVLAEMVSLVGYVWVASQWLGERSMRWPTAAFRSVAASVGVSVVATAAMAEFAGLAPVVMVAAGVALLLLTMLYWKQVPIVARSRAAQIVASIPPRSLSRRVAQMLS